MSVRLSGCGQKRLEKVLMGCPAKTIGAACVALVLASTASSAGALVLATDDPLVFVRLFRPTGQFDETSLSGFEFLISSRAGVFRANDQYLISGEATEAATSLGADLGAVGDLSGVSFSFSIQHNLTGGRNFTFILTDSRTSDTSTLCWGQNCVPGAISTELLNGIAPIRDYNGLQIQLRAQEVVGSSAAVTITSLSGVDLDGDGDPLFDEVVTPDVPGTIPGDAGRRGQWLLGDSLDLVVNEWQLTGVVTLARPDAAESDLTKVRLAVDFVRDPERPFLVPEPSRTLLLMTSLSIVAPTAAWRRRRERRRRGQSGVPR